VTIGKYYWRQVVTFTIFCLALSAPAEGQEEGIVVGVVPFVASSGVGNTASGVAERLVQRLTTSGLKDVRLLSNFESLGKNEVDTKEVERAAKESGVDLLVLGRAAKLGNRLSLDGEVRSGVTGQRIGTPFFVETPAEEDLVGSVDALASRVMEQIPNSLNTVASNEGSEAPSLLSKDSDDPVSIKSRELEAIEDDKGRTLVFKGNVRVIQGGMTLTSESAEAFYPPGSSQPENMKAKGQVVIRSEGRVARCEEATFRQHENVMICREDARIDEGCDRITADEIRFNTKTEKFSARGNVQVQMNREDSSCGEAS
tara:strand:+ start:1318 stop:2259 length:942 start_codon:yes stop_codon:yes gene_type:complete